jgi:hypothetical protein
MSITTTVDLPPDAIISQATNPSTNIGYWKLTITNTNLPYLIGYLLNGVSDSVKDETPLEQKENIARAAGLKYVYRLPSIARTLMIGTACGIALKTMSDNVDAKAVLSQTLSNTGKAAAFSIKLCEKTIDCINLHPYLTSLSLAGTSLLTTQASNETARGVSYVLEETLKLGKMGVKAIESGFIHAAAMTNRYVNFCRNHPKTGFAITASIPAGIALWIKSADVKNMFTEAQKVSANAARNVIKNFRK